MRLRILLGSVLLTAVAWAGIVDDVRRDLSQNNFSAAEAALSSYRSQQGVTGEYLEAYSWLGRGALAQQQYDQAAAYAKQTQTQALELLKQRPLDAEPHLPIALGAALEVQAQVLAARGQRTQAVALLQAALRTYGNTSIQARLQKNLNLLALQGKVAPALKADTFLGAKLPLPAQLKGSPVLLFFWAHWCGDCKAEAPIITQLRSEFAGQGLQVIGPTRLYGYTAQIEHASAGDETAVYRRGAASFLWWVARYAGAGQQVQLRYLRGVDHADAGAAGSGGESGDVPSGGAPVCGAKGGD